MSRVPGTRSHFYESFVTVDVGEIGEIGEIFSMLNLDCASNLSLVVAESVSIARLVWHGIGSRILCLGFLNLGLK